MAVLISDAEIAKILKESKTVSAGQLTRLKNIAQRKNRYRIGKARVKCKSRRKLYLRVNVKSNKPDGFSVMLVCFRGKKQINLIRCNGYQGPHTNHLEKQTIPKNTFHIHLLTERYQRFGLFEHYAEPTDKYHSADSALEYLCNRASIIDESEKNLGFTKRYPLWE